MALCRRSRTQQIIIIISWLTVRITVCLTNNPVPWGSQTSSMRKPNQFREKVKPVSLQTQTGSVTVKPVPWWSQTSSVRKPKRFSDKVKPVPWHSQTSSATKSNCFRVCVLLWTTWDSNCRTLDKKTNKWVHSTTPLLSRQSNYTNNSKLPCLISCIKTTPIYIHQRNTFLSKKITSESKRRTPTDRRTTWCHASSRQ
jgi:hypothetical protein